MTNFFIVQRHGWMKTHDYTLLKITFSREPVSTFDKRPFCLDNSQLCNFKHVEGKQQNLSTTLARLPISLYKVVGPGSISVKLHGG